MICKNSGPDNTIQNYLTLGKVPPVLFNDPNIGLTNLKVTKTSKIKQKKKKIEKI